MDHLATLRTREVSRQFVNRSKSLEKNQLNLLLGYVAVAQLSLSFAQSQLEAMGGKASGLQPLSTGEKPGLPEAANGSANVEHALAKRLAEQAFPGEPVTLRATPVAAVARASRIRRTKMDINALEIKLLEALREKGRPQSAMELCGMTGIDISHMRKLVASAESRGLIQFEGEKRGRKYALASPPSAPALTRVIRRKGSNASAPEGGPPGNVAA